MGGQPGGAALGGRAGQAVPPGGARQEAQGRRRRPVGAGATRGPACTACIACTSCVPGRVLVGQPVRGPAKVLPVLLQLCDKVGIAAGVVDLQVGHHGRPTWKGRGGQAVIPLCSLKQQAQQAQNSALPPAPPPHPYSAHSTTARMGIVYRHLGRQAGSRPGSHWGRQAFGQADRQAFGQ